MLNEPEPINPYESPVVIDEAPATELSGQEHVANLPTFCRRLFDLWTIASLMQGGVVYAGSMMLGEFSIPDIPVWLIAIEFGVLLLCAAVGCIACVGLLARASWGVRMGRISAALVAGAIVCDLFNIFWLASHYGDFGEVALGLIVVLGVRIVIQAFLLWLFFIALRRYIAWQAWLAAGGNSAWPGPANQS